MGGPPGMPDTNGATQGTAVKHGFQVFELSLGTTDENFAMVQHGDSRRVVPPVLKLL